MSRLDSGSTFVFAIVAACLGALIALAFVPGSGWAALACAVLFGIGVIALVASEL